MKKLLKKHLKNFLFKRGYEVTFLGKRNLLNMNPFIGIKSEIRSEFPIFFDVGVNHGQTLDKIQELYPKAIIHGFEPSKKCFESILGKPRNKEVVLNNKAVGDQVGILDFNQYSWDALSSLLKREFTASTLLETYKVEVVTLDSYCEEFDIDHINVLKTDTEGYELKVLQGAKRLFQNNKIQFVLVELFFEPHFVGQSSAGDIMNFLFEHQFRLVRFYDFEWSSIGYV